MQTWTFVADNSEVQFPRLTAELAKMCRLESEVRGLLFPETL